MNIQITYKNLTNGNIEEKSFSNFNDVKEFDKGEVYITEWHAKWENGNTAGGKGRNASADMYEVFEGDC